MHHQLIIYILTMMITLTNLSEAKALLNLFHASPSESSYISVRVTTALFTPPQFLTLIDVHLQTTNDAYYMFNALLYVVFC